MNGWRTSNFDRIASLRKRGFSIFVDNLPQNMDSEWLAQIFRSDGEILDVFVSRKARKGKHQRFGFVRFKGHKEMMRAIERKDGMVVRDAALWVKQARIQPYRRSRGSEYRPRKERGIWRPVIKPNQPHKDAKNDKKPEHATMDGIKRTIKLKVVEEKIQWLKRSVIGTNSYPYELEEIQSKLKGIWPQIAAVRSMGSYKTLITFDNEELKELALSTYKDLLLQIFEEVEAWSAYERSDSKRVWVEIMGVPPQAWSEENFIKIVECWGNFVCFDKESKLENNFEVARVLIDTGYNSWIDEVLYIQLGDLGMDLRLKEIRVVQSSSPRFPEKEVNGLVSEQNSSSTCPIEVKNSLDEEVQSKLRSQSPVRMDYDVASHDDRNDRVEKANDQNLNLGANVPSSGEVSGSEKTKVAISDDRRTEDVLMALNVLPNFIPRSPGKSLGNGPNIKPDSPVGSPSQFNIVPSHDPSTPPGFGKWVGPIEVELAEGNSHLPHNEEPLSSDDENSRDSVEFAIADKVAETGGIKAIDSEKAKEVFARIRKNNRTHRKEKVSNKKGSKSVKKRKNEPKKKNKKTKLQ